MHIYNAWLPPSVSEQIPSESEVFKEVVRIVQQTWQPQNPGSRFATLKWTSFINNLIKAKSDIEIGDLEALAKVGLGIFFESQDDLFIQVRWGNCLTRLFRKYFKKISLQLDWHLFYELLLESHFKRRDSYEGLGIRQVHLETLTSLIRSCRCFFSSDSATEIWLTFRPSFDNLSHNASLEALCFVGLFLPVKSGFQSLTSDWVRDCLGLWDGIPDCPYWDLQWLSLLSRFIKCHAFLEAIDWEPFLPSLFAHFLNSFEVPVGRAGSASPTERRVPHELRFAFGGGWSASSGKAKAIAKSIVYLLRPNGSAQLQLEKLVKLLEQYYHPSNGGSWTSPLEQFLRYLGYFFIKRLGYEQSQAKMGNQNGSFLGVAERAAFVKAVMDLVERGQFSKNNRLSTTSAAVASALSFVSPANVLPFVITRFETAMDTVTATHQLESAIRTLALAARPILLASAVEELSSSKDDCMQIESILPERVDLEFNISFSYCKTVLVDAMFRTLHGMDANDPPKTLATLQLYCSVFSTVGTVGDNDLEGILSLPIDWSQWLEEFLSQLFVLLAHLESNAPTEDMSLSSKSHLSSRTFLMQEQSMYAPLLELLFGRLTRPLYKQALKKVAKFVHGMVTPGAVTEIGLLCSALVYANQAEAVPQLLEPIMKSIISSLEDTPATGFGKPGCSSIQVYQKSSISPALESAVAFKISVLALAVMYGGHHLLQCQHILKEAITCSFDAPSIKVNEAACRLLSSLLESMVLYYPVDQYSFKLSYKGFDGFEEWIGTKDNHTCGGAASPEWHIPSDGEKVFAEELVELHLQHALRDLKNICIHETESIGHRKNCLRVLLLRINGSLRGVRSCLPDFTVLGSANGPSMELSIAGSGGVQIGNSQSREEAANTLHSACEYFLKGRADDTNLLLLLVRNLDLVANFGSTEYGEWSSGKRAWHIDSKSLIEPRINFITNIHSQGKRRPRWMMVEMCYLHNLWRASQSGYRKFQLEYTTSMLQPVLVLSMDLLKLTLHNYDTVRSVAGSSLRQMLKRFPPVVENILPLLISSLVDPEAVEHSALGACALLASRSVLRRLSQDWSSLASFMVALLGSAHHESVKAQTAITELAVAFNIRFGGLPNSVSTGGGSSVLSYPELLMHIKSITTSTSTHWRYKLMGHVALLCLTPPLPSPGSSYEMGTIIDARKNLAGQFLSGLQSELPPLRSLSTSALLLLLHASPHSQRYDSTSSNSPPQRENITVSLEDVVVPIIQDPSFGEIVIGNLSLDHHYAEGHGQDTGSRSSSHRISDFGLMALMPSFAREWPRTRSWLPFMTGKAFSSRSAELFKRLLQECGDVGLISLRRPLEQAAEAVQERGKQCVAAEVMAGIMHSDVPNVVQAFDEWLGDCFHRSVLQSNVESVPEWAASIRFAMTAKGTTGTKMPVLRYKILELLAKSLPASAPTSHVTKRLEYLLVAINELHPATCSTEEKMLLINLLHEVMGYVRHFAPQVRENVGRVLCLLCTIIQHESFEGIIPDESVILGWDKVLVDNTILAAKTIHNHVDPMHNDGTQRDGIDTMKEEVQESVRWMESILHFIIAAAKSGRAGNLMSVIVCILHPVLSLQETSHKDMSGLARSAVYLLKWQRFHNEQLSQAVKSVLAAADDNNWRTRIAALSFMQSFAYRHTFSLQSHDTGLLWGHIQKLLSDPQLEVRELAASTLAGMIRGVNKSLADAFRQHILDVAQSFKVKSRPKGENSMNNTPVVHGIVLGLASCVLSVPYDIPGWLPEMIVLLAKFSKEPSPIRTTVTKAIGEFRRTHADTWTQQRLLFSEEQLEVLSDLSSHASYFA